MILFGVVLRKDWQGLKLTVRLKNRERTYLIKRYPEPCWLEAPKMDCPSQLAEMPDTKPLTPEEIEGGCLDGGSQYGPEDI